MAKTRHDNDVHAWDPPGQGTEARNEMPSHAFLDEQRRRYPYKYENTHGDWVVSERGLMSARNRAAQTGDNSIFTKATRLLNEMREESDEEPLSMTMNSDAEGSLDYGNEIILACESGIKELEAIMDYTRKLQATQNDSMRDVYTDNRLDELPHIQNLVVALTAMLNGEEPTAAAHMDGERDDVNGAGEPSPAVAEDDATPTPPGGDDK